MSQRCVPVSSLGNIVSQGETFVKILHRFIDGSLMRGESLPHKLAQRLD